MQFNINGYIKFKSEKQFITYCDERGIKQNGFETGKHLREILIGKPKFNGLAGPMYDGENSVRYETWATYEMLSK